MAKAARKGLGRGLSSLLKDDRPAVTVDLPAQSANDGAPSSRRRLPIEFLERNVNQPRVYFDEVSLEELAVSI
ncbi:MAG: hypothetical protein JKY34_05310 [Kordiimonadaceae bacterium]|nr:hypothetical protein [Kordiimonadaceae bacterium]